MAPGLTAFDGRPFRRLMIAQDTGSAIVGPARGDLFAGSGAAAGEIAGVVKHDADFYALVPNVAARSGLAMRRRAAPDLTEEDRILWNRVAVTTTPLKRRPRPEIVEIADGDGPMAAEEPADAPAPSPASSAPPLAAPGGRAPGRLDAPTRTKLARERLAIDGSVDLHGLTQAEAHALLLRFLHRAHAGGLRHVLVITGKGGSPGSEGVLRRAVPEWLATAPFRGIVSGHGAAARHHGGAGALYIRLRRYRP